MAEMESKLNLLLIDDSDCNRYAIRRILEKADYHVIEARTGEEGMALLGPEVDLVLLDVKLPDASGFDICHRIKRDPRTSSVPVMQISANFTSGSDKVHGLECGADAYLVQPIEPGVLVATVRALLRVRSAERALQKAVLMRDEFLSIASHELKTPLTSLKLQTQMNRRLISRQGDTQLAMSSLVKWIDNVDRQLDRLSLLVDDMLDITRISTGKLELRLETVDLVQLVQEVVDRFFPDLDRQAECIRVRSAGPVQGVWDRHRLEQVVTNLVTNAIKYGRGQPIDVDVQSMHGAASICVKDRGMGISTEDQPRVFERFERLGSGRDQSGLGLGLYIVREIVRLHGGEIGLESRHGEGSTFTVTLPREMARAETLAS